MELPEKPTVVTEGLTKTYSNGNVIKALDGVSLTVGHAQFTCVMGPSGSGKSTLLNLIGALDIPTSGRLTVAGIDVSRLRGDALADFRRHKIGFVFQLFNLVPELTALENVTMPLLPYRRSLSFHLEARAKELLDRVGMGNRLDHLPGQLSGGEQQRVAIARALVNTPEVVLADEPTGNLDSKGGDEVMELLRDLCDEQGTTVVLATHNPRVAAFADRAFILKDGALVDEIHLARGQSPETLWARLGLG